METTPTGTDRMGDLARFVEEAVRAPLLERAVEQSKTAIGKMEHTHDTDDAKRAIRYLGQAVAQSPFKQTIDRAVMQWMQSRLSRKMPGLRLPQLDDMLKGTDMLETNIDQ
jgi:hypothetical protein